MQYEDSRLKGYKFLEMKHNKSVQNEKKTFFTESKEYSSESLNLKIHKLMFKVQIIEIRIHYLISELIFKGNKAKKVNLFIIAWNAQLKVMKSNFQLESQRY